MASNRNHAVAMSLMNRSISQRAVALSGREMRLGLEAHVHPDGSRIAPCVVDEYVHIAERERKKLEAKTERDAKRAKLMAEAKARREKQERIERDIQDILKTPLQMPSRTDLAIMSAVSALVGADGRQMRRFSRNR